MSEQMSEQINYELRPIEGSDENGTMTPMWAIVPDEGTRAFLIGQEDIISIHRVLGRWLETREHDGWIDSEDFQLAKWINVSEALAQARRLNRFADGPFPKPVTVRKAARDGKIKPAEKVGVDGRKHWEFSKNRFNTWLKYWQIEQRGLAEQRLAHADTEKI